VHGPAPHELDASQGDQFGLVTARLFFAASPEGHNTALVRDQSPVRDRTARHVPSQVLQHMYRFALAIRRTFDENVPIGCSEFIEPRFQSRRILELRPLAFEPQLPVSHQPPKSVDKVLAELSPQLFVVHQERFSAASLRRMAAGDPTSSVERRTAAGDQRVDMRVMVEPLVSGVEHELCGGLELAGTA